MKTQNIINFYIKKRIEQLLDVSILYDFKEVLMVAKIQHFILTNKINEHRRYYLEKRTTQVLNLINKSCVEAVLKDHIDDIVYISTLYIPYLNKPDYLFSKIIKNIQYLQFNSENRALISNFIFSILDKLKPHYDFFVSCSSKDLECNDKYTPDIKTVISLIIKKCIDSKLVSYFLLAVQICSIPNLLKQVYQNDTARNELAQNMTLQIIKILGIDNNKLGFKNLEMFSSFINNNFDYIQDKSVIQNSQCMIFKSIQNLNQKLNDNENLSWIYHHSNILIKFQDDKMIETKQLLKEQFVQKIIKYQKENQVGNVNQIVHQDGIIQNFNNNVNYSNLQNIVFLPSILKNLDININQYQSIQKHLIPKMLKESKFWNGEQLVDNLLNLHEQKINCFEIFENVCDNLFTTMIYYKETQQFQLNNQIYTDQDKLISLINAYAEQYYQHITLNPNYEIKGFKSFVALNVLACYVFKNLSYTTLLAIIDLTGTTQRQYFKPFINMLNTTQFNFTDKTELLQFYTKLPFWVKNMDLSSKVGDLYKQNTKDISDTEIEFQLKVIFQIKKSYLNNFKSLIENQQILLTKNKEIEFLCIFDIQQLKQYYSRQMIFNNEMTDTFIQKLSNDQENSRYFEKLIEYLSNGEIIQTQTQLDTILQYYEEYYNQLSTVAHLNITKIFVVYQIMNGKPLNLPRNFQLHETSFYKTTNKVQINGQEYNIPYQENLSIQEEYQSPLYKIYAYQNRQGDQPIQTQLNNKQQVFINNQQISNSNENQENQNHEIIFGGQQITQDNIQQLNQNNDQQQIKLNQQSNNMNQTYSESHNYDFNLNKQQIDVSQELQNEYFGKNIYEYLNNVRQNNNPSNQQQIILNRFYLYHIIAKKKLNKTYYSEEERIMNEYKMITKENQTLTTQNENYSNFLLDFKNILNEYNDQILYDFNYQKKDSIKIIIDISVKVKQSNKKIGFIFLDQILTRAGSNENEQQQQSLMNSQTIMKKELLEQQGWTIYPIHYESWTQLYRNHSEKQKFIQKALQIQE